MEGVTKALDDSEENLEGLDDVVIWLSGESGSGKTTLTRMIKNNFDAIHHLDLFPVNHIDKINSIDGVPDLWSLPRTLMTSVMR